MGKRLVASAGVDEVLSALVEAFNSSSSNDRVVFLSEDGQSTTERPDPLEYPRLLSVAEVVIGRKASRTNHRLVLVHATGQGQLPAGWTVEYKPIPRLKPLTERVDVTGMPTTADEVDALLVTERKLWDDAHASDEAIPAAQYAPAVEYLVMLKDGLDLVARMKERDPQDILLKTLEAGNALWWKQYQAARFQSVGIDETFRVKPETQQRFLRDLKANSDANTRDLYQRLRARQAKDPEGAASIWAEMADEMLAKHPDLASIKVAERVDVKDIPTYSVMSYDVVGDTEEELKLVARSIRLVKALTIKSAPSRKGNVFVLPVDAHIPTGSADPAQEGFDLIQNAIQKAGVEESHSRVQSTLTEDESTKFINSDLQWLVGPDQDMTWAQAKKWVQSLGEGWRMPTLIELKGLWEANLPIKGRGAFSAAYVWSQDKGIGSAKRFNFSAGEYEMTPLDFPYGTRAMAVREADTTPANESQRVHPVQEGHRRLQDAIVQAKRQAADRQAVRYVFATAYGYAVWDSQPPSGQRYYAVQPDGTVSKSLVAGQVTEGVPSKRTIPVRTYLGRIDWNGQMWSAAVVRQVLEAVQGELQAVFGKYTWYLDGDTGDYSIMAKSLDTKDLWADGHGRTPKQAILDCNATRTIFQKNGWLPSNGMMTDESRDHPVVEISLREDLDVANTILQQLGGRKFIAMTGAKDLMGGPDFLAFRVGANPKRVNKVRITLNAHDYYDVEFFHLRNMKATLLSRVEDVSVDMLRDVFTQNTGLYTSLGTMGRTPETEGVCRHSGTIATEGVCQPLSEDLDVANTILQQLGGRKFIAMTGAKDLMGGPDFLAFRVGANPKRVNKVRITLNAHDYYDVEFFHLRNMKATLLSRVEDVSVDMLRDVFTQNTGLYTSLGTMGRTPETEGVWHGLHYTLRFPQVEGRYIKGTRIESCEFEVVVQCGSEAQAREFFHTLQAKLQEDESLSQRWGLGYGWIRGNDAVSVYGKMDTQDEAAEFDFESGDLGGLYTAAEELVEQMLVAVLGADWEKSSEDDEDLEESVSPTQQALSVGLKGWVKDYILARRAGNIALARSIKANLDREIKKQGLDAHEVYFVFGDPDDPKNDVVVEANPRLDLRTPPVSRPDPVISAVEVWYDPHTRSWIVQDNDAEGNQIGDARYYGDKPSALRDQQSARKQYGLVKSVQMAEGSALPYVIEDDASQKIAHYVAGDFHWQVDGGEVIVSRNTSGGIMSINHYAYKDFDTAANAAWKMATLQARTTEASDSSVRD